MEFAKSVNVLGTEYKIEQHKISEDEVMKKNSYAGYCADIAKLIVYADTTEDEYFPDMDEAERKLYSIRTMRHEIIHAFLNESGLGDSANASPGAWSKNEEMVDWFAIQSPKIFKAFEEVGCFE